MQSRLSASLPVPSRRSNRVPLGALLTLFAACSGGGGGSSAPPDLQVGVNLSGQWEFTTTTTSVNGTLCTANVGDVDIQPMELAHNVATRRLTLDPGTPFELQGTMTGARVNFVQVIAVGGDRTEVRVDLTFAPNGLTCSGTATNIEVFGSDSCTEIGRVTGVRAAGPLLLASVPDRSATDVCLGTTVNVEFTQPLDPQTVNDLTFLVSGPGGLVDGVISHSPNGASFLPLFPLGEGALYTVRLTTAIASTSGTRLSRDVTWTFTTLDYEAEILASDPVAFWRFGPGSNLVPSVVGGSAATAELFGSLQLGNGGLLGTDAVEYFNGVMETTPAFANSVFPGRTTVAIEFWLKPREVRSYQMYCNVGGSVMSLEGNATTPTVWINNNVEVGTISTPLDVWTHVVIQVTGTNAQVFRNGQMVLQSPFTATLRNIFGGFKVGGNGVNDFPSRSIIDEVALYDHALTPAEVARHFTVGTSCL